MTTSTAVKPHPRWRAALVAGSLAALLGGCATTGGSVDGGIETAYDDTEARKRARTRLTLAASYLENGQPMVALDEQKRAAQADPSFSEVYNLGGLIYMALGEKQVAVSQFQRAISLNPRDADAMHNLGWLQCDAGEHAQAMQSFQRALAVPSYAGRAKTLMAQGICQARAGDAAGAEASLMQSYELDAANPVTAYNLVRVLYDRGQFERAQFYIRRLNNSDLANAESLWLGIRVERRLGNTQSVQQLASQLRRRFPGSRELVAYERGAFDD